MTSRDEILERIKTNKPAGIALPEIPVYKDQGELLVLFQKSLEKNGGRFTELDNLNLLSGFIQNYFPTLSKIVSTVPVDGLISIDVASDHTKLKDIELAIVKGEFGVAENGAVWVVDEEMVHRALPFITQHLVLLVRNESILSTMHRAYDMIRTLPSYGVFIAGPSKTADIEQSLVIGAHGPRSLTVVLY